MSPTVEAEHRLIEAELNSGAVKARQSAALSFRPARGVATLNAPNADAHDETHSLFDRFAWLYAFFREKIFRDDTDRIIQVLWPEGSPRDGTRLIELGCGPGFYARRLAARFPSLSVRGIDRSARQLICAQERALGRGLENCRFETDDVMNLSHDDDRFDVLIAARLFTILPDQERAIAEMHRVLRPGGRCFVAEPRYAFWASLPLLAMWVLARFMRMRDGFCEPGKATVLSAAAFKD